jgi:hypothetical protein
LQPGLSKAKSGNDRAVRALAADFAEAQSRVQVRYVNNARDGS